MEKNPQPIDVRKGSLDRIRIPLRETFHRVISGEKGLPFFFLFPSFVLFFGILIIPLAITVYYSFLDYDLSNPSSKGEFIALSNFRHLLHDDATFNTSVANTLKFMAVGIVVELIVGFCLAVLLHQVTPKTRRWFVSFIIIPMMLAPVTVGLVWLFLLNNDYGIIPYILRTLNIGGTSPLLSSIDMAFWTVRAVDLWEWTPFMTLMFLAGLSSLPKAPFEAAEVDQLSNWLKVRYLVIPMLAPIFFIAIFIRLIETFKVFDIVHILTGGGPGTVTETVSTYAYRVVFEYQKYGYGGAQLIVLDYLIILLCVGFFTFSKVWKK